MKIKQIYDIIMNIMKTLGDIIMEDIFLSSKEIEVMEVLWREERSLTSTEIVELSVDSTWKKSSIHILLNSLLSKKAIEVDGFTQTGKNYARTFKPSISFEEYTVMQMQNNKSFSIQSISKIVAALIDNQDNQEDKKSITRDLEALIKKKSKES